MEQDESIRLADLRLPRGCKLGWYAIGNAHGGVEPRKEFAKPRDGATVRT